VLDDWTRQGKSAANLASIRRRLLVTYNSSHANTLKAGSGLDWFWYTYSRNSTNCKASDVGIRNSRSRGAGNGKSSPRCR
jgi:hypothetical protein